MAKVKWNAEYVNMGGDGTLASVNGARNKAVYDIEDGSRVVLSGEKLKADPGDPAELGSGTVTQVVFKDADGDTMMTVKGKFDAEDVGDALSQGAFEFYYEYLFDGNDIVEGSGHGQSIWGGDGDDEINAGGGGDYIGGGRGDDRMKGGAGLDVFVFYQNERGDDVILDFDIKGTETDQLSFSSDIEYIRSANAKKDTLLDMDDGSTILLKNIKRADFIDYWETT